MANDKAAAPAEEEELDDNDQLPQTPFGEDGRCLCSPWRLFLLWTYTFMGAHIRLGGKRPLVPGDLYALPQRDRSKDVTERLDAATRRPRGSSGSPTPLLRAIARNIWLPYLGVGIYFALEAAIMVVQAWMLGEVIQFIDDESIETSRGYYLAGGMLAGAVLTNVLHHQSFFMGARMGMRMRTATIGLIYAKAMRLSAQAFSAVSTGEVINFISNDVERFLIAFPYIHFMWIGPCQIVAVAVLGWDLVGPFILIGLGFIILLVPLHIHSSSVFAKLRAQTAKLTDRRVKIMAELLTGMRVVKMCGWELPFWKMVSSVRNEEAARIRRTLDLRGLNMAFFFIATPITACLIFIPYALADNTVTARKVFAIIGYLNACLLSMTLFFPLAIQSVSELRVSLQRIQRFLDLPEQQAAPALTANGSSSHHASSELAIELEDVTCAWQQKAEDDVSAAGEVGGAKNGGSGGETPLVLQHVSLRVPRGALVGVVGPVGSGKTTLLHVLLNELQPLSGKVRVDGMISYAAQEAWLLGKSVRDNILFGRPYDAELYRQVVRACAMERDLELFPWGDSTLVGERGVTLSGGQKARLNLARAAYEQGADIFLLDDPLSALDSKVGRRIMAECVHGILGNKTRILVTHQVQHLQTADLILVLDHHGSVIGCGSYTELVAAGHDLVAEAGADSGHPDDVPPEAVGLDAQGQHGDENNNSSNNNNNNNSAFKEGKDGPAANVEVAQTGAVTGATYRRFLRVGNTVPRLLLCLFLLLIAQGSIMATEWYLSYWVELDEDERREDKRVGVYGGLVLVTLVLAFVRALVLLRSYVASSQNLHNDMLYAVLHTSVLFHDTSPTGRILNRFSMDMGSIDDVLSWTMLDFLQLAASTLGTVLLVSIVNPYLFIMVAIVVAIFIYVRHLFLKAARNMKRLESMARSPLYAHISSCLAGAVTIRSLRAGERMAQELRTFQDAHGRAFLGFQMGSRWFGFRLDLLTSIFYGSVSFGAVALRSELEAGLVGLSLAYSLKLLGGFQWCVRQSTEIENHMTSVERVLEYSDLPPEEELVGGVPSSSAAYSGQPASAAAPLEVAGQAVVDLPPSWPQHGVVEMHDLSLRYSMDSPDVLRNISLAIRAGEKIGVVGRTGAGKSSLIAALLRLSPTSGRITIDGIDTKSIPLTELRTRVSVIPQDPLLFSGTLRYNLDPFGNFEDAQLWQALEDVELKAAVTKMLGSLDGLVDENGSNFSVGQRQLLCLARALLRNNKVIIMDEATANVDNATDALIQRTMRVKFAQCTQLTIAHRLHTVMDSDRVLVLDAGQVVEFDSPLNLLNSGGIFAKLVEATGSAALAQGIRAGSRIDAMPNDGVPAGHPDAQQSHYREDEV